MSIESNRFEVLDSLRGIAAVSVMLFHYLWAYHNEFGYNEKPLIGFEYGFFGVQLFFIISGFVIYFSITNSRSVGDFMLKRFIRLFPTYWLCVFITFIVVSYFGLSTERDTTVKEALFNLSMLQGIFNIKHVDNSYWSLQIELFFYFFIAFVFLLKLQKYLDFILAGWLLLIFCYNFILKIPGAGLLFNLQYGMFFIAGIGFYKIKMKKGNNIFNHLIILCSYILGLAVLKNMNGYLWCITCIYVIFYLAVYDLLPFLNNPVLLFLGKISYALYLIHDNIGLIILQQLKLLGYNDAIFSIIPTIMSILLAWLITYYYESYISRWLRSRLTFQKIVTDVAQ